MGKKVLEGTLRIKIGKSVVDINEFDVTFSNGQIRMDAHTFRLHGNFEEERPLQNKESIKEKKKEPERAMLSEEKINESIKKEKDARSNKKNRVQSS